MSGYPRPKAGATKGFCGPRQYAGLAVALAVGLIMAVAVAPDLAAAPHCRAVLLKQNWIRVENLDRSLKIYVEAIGFSKQLVKKRTLSKKLAKPAFEGAEVRTADLCRRRGPVHALRIIEAGPEMIDLPPEDQTLVMQFHVQDLKRVVESLPEGLAESGTYGILQGDTSFVFEDFDGNRIILTEGYRKIR